MAEQALVADLRIGLDKFNADLQKAQSAADRATANISKALGDVGSGASPTANEIGKVNTKLDETSKAANNVAKAVGGQLNPALQTMKGVMGALGIDLAAGALVQFGLSAVKAAESLDGVERQLKLLRGSSSAAAAEMAFVRAETDRLALSNDDGAKAYGRLANAAKGTKIEGEGLKLIFQAIGETARATGMSSDEYNRILNQLTQTMAKGKFQGEELTTMAESGIPAYQKLADAMGVTTDRLSEMLQAGEVKSENMLLLAVQLRKDYSDLAAAAATSIPSQFTKGFNTIHNEFVDLVRGALASSEAIKLIKFDSNILDIFPDRAVISQTTSNIIKVIVTVAELTEAVFRKVKDIIVGMFEGLATFLGKMLPNLTSIFDQFTTWSTKLGQALGFVSKDIDTVSLNSDALQKSILGITNIKGVGDVMAPWTGAAGKALAQDINHLVDEISKMLGLELKPLVDPQKQKAGVQQTAKEIPPELQKIIDELIAKASQLALLDPKKEKKLADEVADNEARSLERINKERQRQAEAWAEQERDAADKIKGFRKKLEDDTLKEQEKTHAAFLAILDRTNQERIKAEQETSNNITEIINNMQENIQSTLANSISDAMTGDLDSIEDFTNTIADLFTETAANIASEFLAAFAIEPIMAQVKNGLSQLMGQATQQVQQQAGQMGIGGTGGGFGAIAGGVFAGAGVGMASNQVAGLNNTGGTVGNIAGAVVGGVVGTLAGIGPVIGAAAGSVIGGIIGGLLGKHEEKVRLILQTSLSAPTGPHEGPTSRSPFGVVSLFDQSKVSMEIASTATLAIAEIDAAIAGYLDKQQRAIVEQYFRTAIPEGSTVQAEQMDDAIAKAIQLRLFHALTALTDQATATNVVGEAFSADASSIQAIQQRAMEALAILKMIEEFKVGPLTETAAAIKGINEQFQALADRAMTLGLPIDDIVAEQQRLIEQVTTDFNEGIANSILAIKDPIAAEFAALEAMQQERMQNAIDAGANLAAVEELNALERVELERRLSQERTNIIIDAHEQQANAARAGIVGMTLAITDPFGSAMHQIHQQVIAFEAQVAQGLIPQHLVDEYQRAAIAQAEEQERARQQAVADATADFNREIENNILGLTDSVAAEFAELEQRQQQRMEQAIAAGADLAAVERLNALERADLEARLANESARVIIGANQQVNDSTVRGAQDASNYIVSGSQMVNDSIVSGNNLVNNAIVSGAQGAASAVSSVFAGVAGTAANILGGMVNQANAAARAVNAAAQRASIPRATTGTPVRRSVSAGGYGASGSTGRVAQRRTISIPNISSFSATSSRLRLATGGGYATRPAAPQRSSGSSGGGSSRSSSGGGSSRSGGGGGISRSGGGGGGQSAANRASQQRVEAERRRQEAQRQAEQRRQEAQQKRQQAAAAKANIQGRILDITDPLGSAMRQVNQQIADFRKQSKEGLIPKSLVNQFAKVATAQVKQQEKERKLQEEEEKRGQQEQFGQALLQFVNPALATMNQINQQVREFQELAKKGLIPQSQVFQFRRLALASAQIDKALNAISGGASSGIEQVGDAFKSFIEAGLPEKSQSIQRMQALTDQVAGLIQAAGLLGLSTEDLAKSFKAQANMIRKDAITAIDESFEPRREALKQIDDFLAGMRLDDTLPGLMRRDEARSQFHQAVSTGDIDRALKAADQFLNVMKQTGGGTGVYMQARNEVEQTLKTMQEREAANIERERAIAIRNEERQLQMVSISRSSMDYLRILTTHGTATAMGINEMIKIARAQTNEMVETRKMLARVMNTIRA